MKARTRNEIVEVDKEVMAPGSLHTSYMECCIQKPLNKEMIKRIPHARTQETNLGCLRYAQQGEWLLPGIPNEVTLDLIAPKLPWRTFHILSSVSSGWLGAIRCHAVYDARSRFHSRETLVLINCISFDHCRRIALFSLRDRRFYLLPGILHYESGLPRCCKCISVEGKVYVLGGLSKDDTRYSSEVYVMDLAGQRHWEQCASMKYKHVNFVCAILDGEIYVCNGFCKDNSFVSQVYDPELDTWSPMKSTTATRISFLVLPLGDDIRFYNPIYRTHHLFEIYNPVLDEWIKVDMQVNHSWKALFTAQGKVYLMDKGDVQVYDLDKRSWTHQHSFSFPAPRESDRDIYERRVYERGVYEQATPLAVDNGIVSILHRGGKDLFLESVGFGSKNERITWRTTECPSPVLHRRSLCVVHL